MSLLACLLWLLIVAIAVFYARIAMFGIKVHQIPGPNAYPIFGSVLRFVASSESFFPKIKAFQKEFGHIFIIWFGSLPVVNVTSPDGAEKILNSKDNIRKAMVYRFLKPWLGEGLLTSSGDHWFSHRKLLTPTFHFSILDTFLGVFQEQGEILVQCLSKEVEAGKLIELQPYITRCTMDVINETAMGVKIHAQLLGDEISEVEESSLYINATILISEITNERILNPLYRPEIIFNNIKRGKIYKKNLDLVKKFTDQVISTRKVARAESRMGKRLAFLDLLLETQEQNGHLLSDIDIRDEVNTFMFEGHDTTAASIMWTLYLLAEHEEIQEEVYQEISSIFKGRNDDIIKLKDLAQMKGLERSIKEALRLYPSVPFLARHITEPMQIDGYNIPVGTTLILYIYHLHRDPTVFPDPEKFDPDRFLPENCAGRHPYAYVPFSAGHRNCIGQKFALLEEKMILSQVLRNYKLRLVVSLKDYKIKSELILRPPTGLKFQLIKRNK